MKSALISTVLCARRLRVIVLTLVLISILGCGCAGPKGDIMYRYIVSGETNLADHINVRLTELKIHGRVRDALKNGLTLEVNTEGNEGRRAGEILELGSRTREKFCSVEELQAEVKRFNDVLERRRNGIKAELELYQKHRSQGRY